MAALETAAHPQHTEANPETSIAKGHHHRLPPPRRLSRDDGQRNEHGQHHEGDQQVSPQRRMANPTRHMALEPQPDERLDELVDAFPPGEVSEAPLSGVLLRSASV
jgi:hypothetical protein